MIITPLKEWKWVGVVLGTWNLREISQDFSDFMAQLFTELGVVLKAWNLREISQDLSDFMA